MTIHIRRALREDAAALTAIAHEAKAHWGYPFHWIALWRDALTFAPEFILRNHVYLAEEGGRAAGCYAVVAGGGRATLEHLWVRPAAIGHGHGRRLLEHAKRTAAGLGARELDILSDPHAEAFYSRMGARRVEWVAADVDGATRALPRMVLPLADGAGRASPG
jgi:GNAT superfamily N-acetyltransferase